MTVQDLIGSVVALYLRGELTDDRETSAEGTARFTIDCLSPGQTAAIARQVLADPVLRDQVELKLPAHALAGEGLAPEILTPLPATYFRNATAAKPALLVANTGDDEEQSLKEFIRIGAPQLL